MYLSHVVVAIAKHFLTNLRDQPDTFRVVFFGFLETPHLTTESYTTFLSRLLDLETRLFERAYAARAGDRSAPLPGAGVDPRLVARSLHGSLLFYNLAAAVVRMEPLPRDPKALAEAVVSLYL